MSDEPSTMDEPQAKNGSAQNSPDEARGSRGDPAGARPDDGTPVSPSTRWSGTTLSTALAKARAAETSAKAAEVRARFADAHGDADGGVAEGSDDPAESEARTEDESNRSIWAAARRATGAGNGVSDAELNDASASYDAAGDEVVAEGVSDSAEGTSGSSTSARRVSDSAGSAGGSGGGASETMGAGDASSAASDDRGAAAGAAAGRNPAGAGQSTSASLYKGASANQTGAGAKRPPSPPFISKPTNTKKQPRLSTTPQPRPRSDRAAMPKPSGSSAKAMHTFAATRSVARKLALQALYRGQLNDSPWQDLVLEFGEAEDMPNADREYFRELVEGIWASRQALDGRLAELMDRPPEQLDPVEHAILLIGLYELTSRPEVPYRVSINEAVGLTKRFGATDGHKFVNAVLDRAARVLRPDEN